MFILLRKSKKKKTSRDTYEDIVFHITLVSKPFLCHNDFGLLQEERCSPKAVFFSSNIFILDRLRNKF